MNLMKRDEIFLKGNPRLIKEGVSVKNALYCIERRVNLPLSPSCDRNAIVSTDTKIVESGQAEKSMGAVLGEHMILSYHETPPITRVLCNGNDHSLGVELEMVADSNMPNFDVVYPLVTGNWYNFFHDGSLPSNGEELVTTCLPERLAMQPGLWEGLTDVLRLIFSAWKCQNCGLHVHCGRDFFMSEKYAGIPYDSSPDLNSILSSFPERYVGTPNPRIQINNYVRGKIAEAMLVYLYYKIVPSDMKFDVFKRVRTYMNEDICSGYSPWLDLMYDFRRMSRCVGESFFVSLMKITQLRHLVLNHVYSLGTAYDSDLSTEIRMFLNNRGDEDPEFKSRWVHAVDNGMKAIQLLDREDNSAIDHGFSFVDLRTTPAWISPYIREVSNSLCTSSRHEDRYREVNLTNLDTVEFRLGKATVNAESILCMEEFCRLLMRYTGTRMLSYDFDNVNVFMDYIIHETTSEKLAAMAKERMVV